MNRRSLAEPPPSASLAAFEKIEEIEKKNGLFKSACSLISVPADPRKLLSLE
jgi:hypothetical protein